MALKEKSREKEAEALIDFVDNKLNDNNQQSLKMVAAKEDIANLRAELKEDVANLRTSIADTKAETI